MLNSIISSITSVFSACVGWFEDIFSATGGATIHLSMVFVVLSIRVLLAPVLGRSIGGRGSDTVRKKKSGDADNE